MPQENLHDKESLNRPLHYTGDFKITDDEVQQIHRNGMITVVSGGV